MGTPGVPLQIPRDVIIAAIKKCGGIVYKICEELNCSHTKLYDIFKTDPEIKQALDAERNNYYENKIDKADSIIDRILDSQEDMDRSLKAAMFLLNTHEKARLRGYAPPNLIQNDQEGVKCAMKDIAAGIALLRSERPSKQNTSPDETHASEQLPEADLDKSQ